MPQVNFTNLERLTYLNNAVLTHKHDLEDTQMVAVTHREMALVMLGQVLTRLVFPEYDRMLDDFVDKLQAVTQGTGFFDTRFANPQEGEEPDIDSYGGGD